MLFKKGEKKKSFWQSLAWRPLAEDTCERCFWKNVLIGPMLLTRQISEIKSGKEHEDETSPTRRSHLTNSPSPVHPQHHDKASWHVSNTPTWWRSRHVLNASEYTTFAAYRTQENVNKEQQWTNDWDLQTSEMTAQATVFSLSTSKDKFTIKLGDKTPRKRLDPTFLRLKFDTLLSWKRHVEDKETIGIKKLVVLN